MPTSVKEYFFYTIKDASITIVFDLLFGDGTFVSGFATSVEFMDYDGGTGISNKDRILQKYTVEEQTDYSIRVDYDNFPLKYGTLVLLPFAKIDRDIIPLLGDNVISTDVNAFIADQLRKNYTDPKHTRAFTFKSKSLGSYKESFLHISVWVWSKALSCKIDGIQGNETIGYEDTIINITPYISSISTNVNQNGGSFNFVLDPILGKFKNKWQIDDATIKKTSTEHIAQSSIRDHDAKRQKLFFDNALQENDVVFIRFETLKSELDRLDKTTNTFEIDKRELQFKTFDLIGLIDTVQSGNNFSSNDLTLNVSGRDLMKLFIEDGVYFYPYDYVDTGIFANESTDDRLERYDGQLIGKFQTGYKKIENVLKFIINALGTIKICSDTLFDSYRNLGYLSQEEMPLVVADYETSKDRRTHKYKITKGSVSEVITIQSDVNKALKDDSITAIKESRKDSNLPGVEQDASAEQIYNALMKFCKEADAAGALYPDGTWKSFTMSNGDILNDNQYPYFLWSRLYYYDYAKIEESPLFINNNIENKNFKILKIQNPQYSPTIPAQTAVKTVIQNYFKQTNRDNNTSQSIASSDLVEATPLKGIWQIVKLVIDNNVQKRIVADSSIGNEHGSLLNAVRKVCQDPFVEFCGDTYGDQYYLTVRKPPFDQESILSMLDGIVIGEDGKKVKSSPIIIDIEDGDILSENLAYGGPAYSWYRLVSNGLTEGGDSMAFALGLRAVYLKEYADLFGSKPLDITSNYMPYAPLVSKDMMPSQSYMIKQGIYDLQYLIQSHAYLPFIRRGTITLANGDRRIKRGTLVRLVSTNEIGLVEAVNNSASISMNSVDRTTVISVDRIMVEDFVRGIDVQGIEKKVNYFNLVNTEIDPTVFEKNNSYVDFNKEVLGKWKVNAEVLNFFLQKRQFV